jgi:hypothetical protein
MAAACSRLNGDALMAAWAASEVMTLEQTITEALAVAAMVAGGRPLNLHDDL